MTDMRGKTVLITGANQGIGKAAAEAIAKMGADVTIVARSEEKGRAAVADIVKISGNSSVELLVGDLSSIADTRRVAGEFLDKHTRLDVLLNNAGVLVTSRRTSVDGLELTFATNHVGYFVLTEELLPLLKKTASETGHARIVSVSSDAHRRGVMKWDDLQLEHGWLSWRAYAQSKLANILFTRELAKRLEGTGITANCLHPGVIASGFAKTDGGVTGFLAKLAAPFLATTADGAKTSVYLATSPDVTNVTGKYFAKSAEAKPNRAARDEDAPARLWKATEEIVAKVPRVP